MGSWLLHGFPWIAEDICSQNLCSRICPWTVVFQVTFSPQKPQRKSLLVCENESKEWRGWQGQNLWFSLLKLLNFLLRGKNLRILQSSLSFPAEIWCKLWKSWEGSGVLPCWLCAALPWGCSFVPLFSQASEFLGVWGRAGTVWQSSPCLPAAVGRCPLECSGQFAFPHFRHNHLRGPQC